MVYTLSSPTVLAVDAACHPCGAEILGALGDAFRLTERGVTRLGLRALDADHEATALAWGMVEMVDAGAVPTATTLRFPGAGRVPEAGVLARTRLGDVRDVTRLVVTEAAPWPDAARVPVAGGRRAAGSAAAAAAVVAARWTSPDLPPEHVEVLTWPWLAAAAADGELTAPADASYGPHSESVVALRTAVADGVRLLDLAQVRWAEGDWARSMHAAAWAAFTSGRLREQLLAVVDVTAALLRAEGRPDPVLLRDALPALHALTVARVVPDLLEPSVAADLCRGSSAVGSR
ncbi:hypothetical protein [Actinotalea sp. K2]|uniref:hypothetical protein n=1 Tax=Actinotalea sp. K2 TaxID=2939438 RepID=UPI002017FC75|nr:hypothetical protein [Actinotalea sp. K2]MCL3863264.1 hypothetical protein [Actinotalea sp. K2]